MSTDLAFMVKQFEALRPALPREALGPHGLILLIAQKTLEREHTHQAKAMTALALGHIMTQDDIPAAIIAAAVAAERLLELRHGRAKGSA